MEIVLNMTSTGFDVSTEVYENLINCYGWKAIPLPEEDEDFENVDADIFIMGDEYDFVQQDLYDLQFRMHPDLVEVVGLLGEDAWTEAGAEPCVVNMPALTYTNDPVIVEVPYDKEYIVAREDLIG